MYTSPNHYRTCLRGAFALLLAFAIAGVAGPAHADDGSGDLAAQQTAEEQYQQLINGPVTTETCTTAWEMAPAENGNQCNSVTVSTSSDNCSVSGSCRYRATCARIARTNTSFTGSLEDTTKLLACHATGELMVPTNCPPIPSC